MGRKKLEVPNAPINVCIPQPMLAALRSLAATAEPIPTWRNFVTEIIELGLLSYRAGNRMADDVPLGIEEAPSDEVV